MQARKGSGRCCGGERAISNGGQCPGSSLSRSKQQTVGVNPQISVLWRWKLCAVSGRVPGYLLKIASTGISVLLIEPRVKKGRRRQQACFVLGGLGLLFCERE